MTCPAHDEIAELLGGALSSSDVLDAREQARLEAHLSSCEPCRNELTALRRVVSQLEALRQTTHTRRTFGEESTPRGASPAE